MPEAKNLLFYIGSSTTNILHKNALHNCAWYYHFNQVIRDTMGERGEQLSLQCFNMAYDNVAYSMKTLGITLTKKELDSKTHAFAFSDHSKSKICTSNNASTFALNV